MKLYLLLCTLFLFTQYVAAQTVIEMTHPGDANLVLLVVDKPEDADLVVYKTNIKEEYQEWNCKWKFKKWGFSNFSVYITNNVNDSLLFDEDMGIQYSIQGRIYFTNNKEEAGYKTPGFQLEGVLRKTSVDNSNEAKESKQKVLENEQDEE